MLPTGSKYTTDNGHSYHRAYHIPINPHKSTSTDPTIELRKPIPEMPQRTLSAFLDTLNKIRATHVPVSIAQLGPARSMYVGRRSGGLVRKAVGCYVEASIVQEKRGNASGRSRKKAIRSYVISVLEASCPKSERRGVGTGAQAFRLSARSSSLFPTTIVGSIMPLEPHAAARCSETGSALVLTINGTTSPRSPSTLCMTPSFSFNDRFNVSTAD